MAEKKFAGLYKVDSSSNWVDVSNGAIGFGQWQDDDLGKDVSAKLIYANGITYNVADALKLRDVSNHVSGLKITLNSSGVIDTSFGATIESGDSYVQIGKSSKEGAKDGSIAISLNTCNVSDASDVEGNKKDGVATALDVQKYVNAQIGTLSQALVFKGEVSDYDDLSSKQKYGKTGDTYVVTTGWDAKDGHGAADAGDMFILEVTSETTTYIWHQVERNLDGAVTAAEALTKDKVILGGDNQTVKATAYSLGSDTYNASTDSSVLATEKWVEGAVNTAAKSLTVSTSDNSIYINLLDGSTTPQTLSSVEVKKDSYVTVSAETADKNSVTIGLNTCNVSDASDAEGNKKDGVATALDVQKYVADQLEWHILS